MRGSGFAPEWFASDRPDEHGVESGVEWTLRPGVAEDSWNGYVRLPDGHPWMGLGEDDIPVDVHGGLTYKNGPWIGFDTVHAGDGWRIVGGRGRVVCEHEGHRWAKAEVVEEAKRLARQVADVLRCG